MSAFNFQRYSSETADADGTPLIWPGGPEGYPYRGNAPPALLKDEEYEQLKLSGKFRCRIFYLNDDKHKREYEIIRDKCANNFFVLLDKDRQWDEETQNYRIYIEWLEIAYEGTPGGTDAVRNYTKNESSQSIEKLAGISKSW